MAETGEQQSNLKRFLASIATIKGDLSNITAPPFVLADKSTTEFPRYWIEQPDLFCAPASEEDPAKRILAVTKWFLSSLRAQQYAGRKPGEGVKKPLNAFLGEVFKGGCGSGVDETCLIAEQVSHHPPVTACYLWNENHGVRAEGYTRQKITFSGSVNVQQIGHAILHLDHFKEDYLIPLPDVKVKGILTGSPYPELVGSHAIVCSSGYTAQVDFSGCTLLGFSGEKNHFDAKIYAPDDAEHQSPIWEITGTWSHHFEIKDSSGQVVDSYDVESAQPTEFWTAAEAEQDPWESRKAWSGVIKSIHAGDMQGVADAKSELEKAQRELRKHADTSKEAWKALFFKKESSHPVAEQLLSQVGRSLEAESTCGVWRFNASVLSNLQRPWRGDLTPRGRRG